MHRKEFGTLYDTAYRSKSKQECELDRTKDMEVVTEAEATLGQKSTHTAVYGRDQN